MERAQVLMDIELLTQQLFSDDSQVLESHVASIVLRGLKVGLCEEVGKLCGEVIAEWVEEKTYFRQTTRTQCCCLDLRAAIPPVGRVPCVLTICFWTMAYNFHLKCKCCSTIGEMKE
eukprot:gene32901-40616_t